MLTIPFHRRERGFTLIELLIALIIVAVLAAIALPAFFDQIRKSRRADAISAMSQVQQAQERWRANNTEYNTSSTFTGLQLTPPTTYYSYSNTTPASAPQSQTTHGVAATAAIGSSQTKDGGCQYMRVDIAGGNPTYLAGTSSATAASGAAANRCWRR